MMARGILVGRLPFQNTSLIVSWVTPDPGRIKTMVRGALRPNGKFSSLLDLFYLCELQIRPARTGDLHGLSEVSLVEPFLGLRQNYETVKVAHYFCEIIQSLTEPNTPIPEYFELLEKALGYLNTHPADEKVIKRFENRALEIAGIRPGLHFARTLSEHGFPVPSLLVGRSVS